MFSYCPTDTFSDNPLTETRNSNPQGPDGIAMEGIIAKVWAHFTEPYQLLRAPTIPKLNLDESDDEFRRYLDGQGIEMDVLLSAAGEHFASPIPSPKKILTALQRKIIAEDTLRGVSN